MGNWLLLRDTPFVAVRFRAQHLIMSLQEWNNGGMAEWRKSSFRASNVWTAMSTQEELGSIMNGTAITDCPGRITAESNAGRQ